MSKAAGQRNGNQRKKDTAATRDKKEQLYAAGRKEAEAVVEEGIAFMCVLILVLYMDVCADER